MLSNHETFFTKQRYAVVGHAKASNFPTLTYNGLKKLGKTVYPVDPSISQVEGDKTFPNLDSIPSAVDAVVLEVPKNETKQWIASAAALGISDVWIHMERETDEALQLAKEKGMNVRTGTCAVMYVTPGFTFHSIHKLLRKLSGRY